MGPMYDTMPPHIREELRKDPMFLQRKHDEEVRRWRLLSGADVWVPRSQRAKP